MIHIDGEYYINVEDNCYTLRRRRTSKPKTDGKEPQDVFEILGYYGTLGGVLKGLGKEVTAETLKPLSTDIADAFSQVADALSHLDKTIESAVPRLKGGG